MSELYVLSNGETTTDYPYFFEQVSEWTKEAKEISKKLRWTKKVNGDEWLKIWRDNPDVQRYRELLRLIWEYKQDVSIVEVKNICDEEGCLNTDTLTIKRQWNDSIYSYQKNLCVYHLVDEIIVFRKDATYTLVEDNQ